MRRPVPNPALPMAMQPGAGLRGLNPLPTPGFSGRAGGCPGLSPPAPGPPEGASATRALRGIRPSRGCCRRWGGGSEARQRGTAASPRPSSQRAAPVLGLVRIPWRQEVGCWELIDVGLSRDAEGGARASVSPAAPPAQRNLLFLLFLHKIPESVHSK